MSAIPPVVPLFKTSSPADVSRLIITVIVRMAIQGQAGRTRSNMRKERLEAVTPRFTHRDAPAAIISVPLSLGIETAGLCACPYAIFVTPIFSPRLAVFDTRPADEFGPRAFTTFYLPVLQIIGVHHCCVSTITLAKPPGMRAVIGCSLDHNKVPKLPPYKINKIMGNPDHSQQSYYYLRGESIDYGMG